MKPGKPSQTDLHIGLGKDRAQRKPGIARFSTQGMAGAAAVAAMVGLSLWTSLEARDNLTKIPEQQVAEADAVVAAMPENPPPVNSTAKAPDMDSGRSGASIQRTTTNDGNVVSTWSPKPRDSGGPVMMSGQTYGQDPRMAATPNEDLLEDGPDGKLPVIGADGLRPMEQYARPWSGARGTRISIVIGGLGLSQTGTQRAIKDLPPEVTLAFAASGNSLQRWMQEARRNGHEILLQIPMEPFDYPANDPGPDTLVTGKNAAANLARLHGAMAKITNYTGIVNYLGGKFTTDIDALEPVMRDIAGRGLLFLDDGSSAQSRSGTIAKAISGPHAFADMQLDGEVNEQAILKRLDDLERIARRNGQAIGIASAFDESIAAVSRWANEASIRGIEIVGVSALASGEKQQ